MKISNTTSVGTSPMFLLTLLFVGLKLTHNIDWSWWWVLSPMWIGASLIAAIVSVVFVFAIIKHHRNVRNLKNHLRL